MIDKDYTNNNDVTYTSFGSPIYDPMNDYDESRELDDEETEYDDEGYPVGLCIPSLQNPKTEQQSIEEEKEQRKITIWVIMGCLSIIAGCIVLALIIVKP